MMKKRDSFCVVPAALLCHFRLCTWLVPPCHPEGVRPLPYRDLLPWTGRDILHQMHQRQALHHWELGQPVWRWPTLSVTDNLQQLFPSLLNNVSSPWWFNPWTATSSTTDPLNLQNKTMIQWNNDSKDTIYGNADTLSCTHYPNLH